MARRTFASIFFLLLLLMLDHGRADAAESCKRIDASVVQNDKLHLIFGTEYVAFDPDKRNELARGQVSDLYQDFPANSHIDAAFALPEGVTVLITGKTYTLYNNVNQKAETGHLSDYFKDKQFFFDGLDAAVSIGRMKYFFKGCQILKEELKDDGSELSELSLEHFGIPCSLDAAVQYKDQIFMAKNEYVWIIDTSYKVSGPFCYASFLYTDYNLCKCKLE